MASLHERVPAARRGTTPSHPRISTPASKVGAEEPCPRDP